MQGSTVLATVALGGGGAASFTTTSLPLGSTAITAVYTGAGGILGSTSPTLSVSVVPYRTVTIADGLTQPEHPGAAGHLHGVGHHHDRHGRHVGLDLISAG